MDNRVVLDSVTSAGFIVVSKKNHRILYSNPKAVELFPFMTEGKRCLDYTECKREKCPLYRDQIGEKDRRQMRYLKEWNGFVELCYDECDWEGTPSYLVTIVCFESELDNEKIGISGGVEGTAIREVSKGMAFVNVSADIISIYYEEDSDQSVKGDSYSETLRNNLEKIHPDDRKRYMKTFSREHLLKHLEKGQKTIMGEYRKRTADGGYRWISQRAIPMSKENGEDRLCILLRRDINFRKTMELQMASKLDAAYQAIPGGIAFLSIDGRISLIRANRTFFDMTGYAMNRKNYEECIYEEDRARVVAKMRNDVAAGNSFEDTFRLVKSNGSIMWVRLTGARIEVKEDKPVYMTIHMDVTELKNVQQELIDKQRIYRENTDSVIDVLSSLVEFRDVDSGEHVQRTRVLTGILLENMKEHHPELELTDEMVDKISSAAALHDVGKISIPDAILNKPGRLTEDEFEEMKKHTVKGYDIVKKVFSNQDSQFLQYSMDIIRHHHERWDGHGYPDGLRESQITLWAQVVGIVDVYDALVSPRVYKAAYSHEKALQMILDGECGCFNPELLQCLKETAPIFRSQYLDA